MQSIGWGLIPWGIGNWGLPVPPSPIPPSPSNIHVINVVPSPGSFNISRSQTFTFTIKSNFFALNPANTHIFLDNQYVVNGLAISPNFAVVATPNIDGISVDYRITPNYLFGDADVFTLQIYATDIYGNPSFPFWAGYVVIDTRPPLVTPIYPLDGYVNVPIDLTLHFLVNQLASPNAGLIPSTLSVYVDDIPAVISGIIQAPFDGLYSEINLPSFSDITTPFEILLDYAGRYPTNEIVVVSVSCDSVIIPIIDANSIFLNQYGQAATDAYNTSLPMFSITGVSNLSRGLERVSLSFGAGPNLITDGYITDGYQLQNTNGNTFRILDIIDGYHINVEVLPKTLQGKYSFVTAAFDTELVTPVFAGYFQGVYLVDNLGDGYHINVTWHPARTTRPDKDLAYLIYYSTVRSDVFFEEPKLITQGRKLPPPETIPGADAQLFGFFAEIPLPVGVSYYFGVRATEFPHSTMPVIPADGYSSSSLGLTVVDGYSFAIPTPQILMTAVVGSGAIIIPVVTTNGYVRAGGYITIGAEIVRYTSLTTTTFIISAPGRGQFGTTIQNTHNVGELIKLYYGNYDDNTVIAKNLVSWEPPNDPHRTRPDLVTTDFTLEDGYDSTFEPFDFCGYHRQRPDLLFSDQQCNTYVGGEFNGHRGLFLTERLLANEESLLEVTGEPVILLKRIWQGETCICRTSRKDSSRVRSCSTCFGTGFKGGFIQYNNPRRNDRRIMVHYTVNDEEIKFASQGGIEQAFKPNAWTLNIPSIIDRDILVKFDQEDKNKIQWIYVVNNVSRGETVFGSATRQRMNVSRMDRTDVIYMYRFVK